MVVIVVDNLGVKKMKICKNCNKKIYLTKENKKYYKRLQYCNRKCFYNSKEFKESSSKGGKIGGVMGGKKSQITQRKNKTNFYNSEFQSDMGKRGGKQAQINNKKNKKGFYNSEFQSKMGKKGGIKGGKRTQELYPNQSKENGHKSQKILKRLNKGFYGLTYKQHSAIGKISGKLGWKKANETNKRNGTGIYNFRTNIKSIESNRKNKSIKLFNMSFDSNLEKEIALCLLKQKFIKKLINRINCHIVVGHKEYDFLIQNRNLFLEYHPWDWNKLTEMEYYNKRRNNLNINGYKNYNLIVIK